MINSSATFLETLVLSASKSQWKEWLLSRRKIGVAPQGNIEITTLCWLWEGNHTEKGYPQVHTSRFGHKRHVKIVYIVAFLWLGWDPYSRYIICHKCDNRGCWRPSHIYLGTYSRNAVDRSQRTGHYARGETHGMTKLSEIDVSIIRERVRQGQRVTAVAKDFNVSHATVSHIINRKTWGHVR